MVFKLRERWVERVIFFAVLEFSSDVEGRCFVGRVSFFFVTLSSWFYSLVFCLVGLFLLFRFEFWFEFLVFLSC